MIYQFKLQLYAIEYTLENHSESAIFHPHMKRITSI